MATTTSNTAAKVRRLYRELYHHISRLPESQQSIPTTTTSSTINNGATTFTVYKSKSSTKQRTSLLSKNDLLKELRSGFRVPLSVTETSNNNNSDKNNNNNNNNEASVEGRIKIGESKLAFLRMTTVSIKPRYKEGSPDDSDNVAGDGSATANDDTAGNTTTNNYSGTKRWVYKDGNKYENRNGTFRDPKTGRVLSPYYGYNLDPEAVTKHKKLLRRAGFVNNQHAKGIF